MKWEHLLCTTWCLTAVWHLVHHLCFLTHNFTVLLNHFAFLNLFQDILNNTEVLVFFCIFLFTLKKKNLSIIQWVFFMCCATCVIHAHFSCFEVIRVNGDKTTAALIHAVFSMFSLFSILFLLAIVSASLGLLWQHQIQPKELYIKFQKNQSTFM